MIQERKGIFVWLLGTVLLLSMLPSHSLAQEVTQRRASVSVHAHYIDHDGEHGEDPNEYYDWDVEFTVTTTSNGEKTDEFQFHDTVRIFNDRAWMDQGEWTERFDVTMCGGRPPEGFPEKVPASVVDRVHNRNCECDPNLKADFERQNETAHELFTDAYEQIRGSREEFLQNLTRIFDFAVVP